jgi:alkylhydroperoxidase family enzyme
MSVAARSASAPAKEKPTHSRSNYAEQSPELLKKFTEQLGATRESAIEEPIRDLVPVRAVQINGCAFASTCTSSRRSCQSRACPMKSMTSSALN